VEAAVQDAEGGVVCAGDNNNDIFWNDLPVLPNKKAMLCN
jgi:hypothetical protein